MAVDEQKAFAEAPEQDVAERAPLAETPEQGSAGQGLFAEDPESDAAERKRDLRIVIIWAVLVMVLLVIGVLYLFLRKTRIPLNEYLQIETEGIDTIGTARFHFDADAFLQDYKETIRYRGGKANTKVGDYANAAEALLYNCIGGSLNKESDLTNGDTVTFLWECNDALAEADFHSILVYSNVDTVVENLAEAEPFDPFAGITVEFSGTSPQGTAEVRLTSDEEIYASLQYRLDKAEGLSNGDRVKVTVTAEGNADVADATRRAFGKVPTTLEKEYTVDGLTVYMSSLQELSGTALQEMQMQAEEIFREQEVPLWKSGASLLNRQYLGSYLLTPLSAEGTMPELSAEATRAILESITPKGTYTELQKAVLQNGQAPFPFSFGWGSGEESEEDTAPPSPQNTEEQPEGTGFQWSDLLDPSFYGIGIEESEDSVPTPTPTPTPSAGNSRPDGYGWFPFGQTTPTPTPTPEPDEDWYGLSELFSTEEFTTGRQNMLYLVYRVDVSLRGTTALGGSGVFSYYTYTAFSDIRVLPDGSLETDLENYHVPTGSHVLGVTSGDVVSARQGLRTYFFSGFDSLNSLYRRCVYEQRETYACESNVEE